MRDPAANGIRRSSATRRRPTDPHSRSGPPPLVPGRQWWSKRTVLPVALLLLFLWLSLLVLLRFRLSADPGAVAAAPAAAAGPHRIRTLKRRPGGGVGGGGGGSSGSSSTTSCTCSTRPPRRRLLDHARRYRTSERAADETRLVVVPQRPPQARCTSVLLCSFRCSFVRPQLSPKFIINDNRVSPDHRFRFPADSEPRGRGVPVSWDKQTVSILRFFIPSFSIVRTTLPTTWLTWDAIYL